MRREAPVFDITQPFALIQREDHPSLVLLTGTIQRLESLSAIPRNVRKLENQRVYHTLSLIPFSQIREKGFLARSENEEILCLEVREQRELPLGDVLQHLFEHSITFSKEPGFDESEEDYLRAVRSIIDQEIGSGKGANFVLPRTCRGQISNWDTGKGLAIFRRLLQEDYGTYWKFAFFDGDSMFIGSTPEQHLAVERGTVTMNPISGTFRKNPQSTPRDETMEFEKFLQDEKEIYELFMVVDEELKMMSEMCPEGGQVIGPRLREMSRLIHTEYQLVGKSRADIIELLRQSLFAATVTGSPLKSACEVIARYEKTPRRYYASALALIGDDETGQEFLDSPILIRTLEVSADGRFQFRVGASLVRDSDPKTELAETNAKGRAVLFALQARRPSELVAQPVLPNLKRRGVPIEDMLSLRNEHLSKFWLEPQLNYCAAAPLSGKSILLVDNEDGFVYMLAHMFRALGAISTVVSWNVAHQCAFEHDILLVGPGPGDPRDANCPKMIANLALLEDALIRRHPLLAICLGHQVLCRYLGLPLVRGKELHQGIQREINLFGRRERVGFYNTFWGLYGSALDSLTVSKDNDGRLYGLRGEAFAGYQFHAESILSPNGLNLLLDAVNHVLGTASLATAPE
jgi:phenazine biosynthesis protein phzE